VDPAIPARRAAFRHARWKGTTRSNQKQELPTTGQTPKAHGIAVCLARRRCALEAVKKLVTAQRDLFCPTPTDRLHNGFI
jgi:hypothetical protein